MPRKLFITTACLIVAGIGCGIWLLISFKRNRVVVRNASGVEVRDIRLVLHAFDGKWRLVKDIRALPPGEAVVVRHGRNDLRAELRFDLAGTRREHEEPYIDLWTGEGWVFEIQPDGTVKTGHDYPESD